MFSLFSALWIERKDRRFLCYNFTSDVLIQGEDFFAYAFLYPFSNTCGRFPFFLSWKCLLSAETFESFQRITAMQRILTICRRKSKLTSSFFWSDELQSGFFVQNRWIKFLVSCRPRVELYNPSNSTLGQFGHAVNSYDCSVIWSLLSFHGVDNHWPFWYCSIALRPERCVSKFAFFSLSPRRKFIHPKSTAHTCRGFEMSLNLKYSSVGWSMYLAWNNITGRVNE